MPPSVFFVFFLYVLFPVVSSITIVVNKEECLRLYLEQTEVLTGSFVVVDGGSNWREDSAEIDFQVNSIIDSKLTMIHPKE